MAHTYHELKEKTIQELRDIAKDVEHDAVKGYSQMNKDHLLPALCKALGIDTHEHHAVVGIDKPAIKAQMRERFHAEDRLMLWFDFNNHDSKRVMKNMEDFMTKVAPEFG